MKPRKKAKAESVAKSYDELDAVREISGILEIFEAAERERILRWVRERLSMDALPEPVAVAPTIAPAPARSAAVVRPSLPRVNPHEMAKPPLNKLIVQDDDVDGPLLGIPADNDLPEPVGIDQVKPKGPSRQLVTKKFRDGSTAVVMK